jgi:hypothetical protein
MRDPSIQMMLQTAILNAGNGGHERTKWVEPPGTHCTGAQDTGDNLVCHLEIGMFDSLTRARGFFGGRFSCARFDVQLRKFFADLSRELSGAKVGLGGPAGPDDRCNTDNDACGEKEADESIHIAHSSIADGPQSISAF